MKWLLLRLIRFYQIVLSLDQGWLGKIIPHQPVCRFEPSCSTYAYQAIDMHGSIRGIGLAANRLRRCHPWGDYGPDPVPTKIHKKKN